VPWRTERISGLGMIWNVKKISLQFVKKNRIVKRSLNVKLEVEVKAKLKVELLEVQLGTQLEVQSKVEVKVQIQVQFEAGKMFIVVAFACIL
jgi:hypothetical protein